MPYGAIKSFDMNTLQSNNPIEDAHAEATVKNGSGNSTEVIKGGILKNDAYCWAILLKIVLHKFTNPKIRNQCCNMFEHVFHSVLLHLPYILLETTSIFTLGFSSLILWNLIFHWWHKEKMCFLKPLCVSRTYWHMKVFSIMTNEYSFEMKHFAGL